MPYLDGKSHHPVISSVKRRKEIEIDGLTDAPRVIYRTAVCIYTLYIYKYTSRMLTPIYFFNNKFIQILTSEILRNLIVYHLF